MIARNKPAVCVGAALNPRDPGRNRRNAVRVHVSYRTFSYGWAFRRYVASAADMGWLMLLFHGTIEALVAAQESDTDAFEAVDKAVGWPKLLRVRPDVRALAGLASEDPLIPAADRWKTLHKFAPALIAALEFRAARANDPMLAALQLLRELSQSGKREIPADAPMPFRKACAAERNRKPA